MYEKTITAQNLFLKDFHKHKKDISALINGSSVLIVGGAGSIGRSVVKLILEFRPKYLHIIDISENGLVELVRDVRSSNGNIETELKTYVIDIGSVEFSQFCNVSKGYDYVLNFSALKHVRSERDEFSLMRLIRSNAINAHSLGVLSSKMDAKKYFCVSTDKAANPQNLMGASKRAMEKLLMSDSVMINTTMARFANVAFSDGSLLDGFLRRFEKKQPLAAPIDIERYFISHYQASLLCLMACFLGRDREIFFPNNDTVLKPAKFSDIALNLLSVNDYQPRFYEDEKTAIIHSNEDIKAGFWPCYFFESSTTGEKSLEEFFTDKEKVELRRFQEIGVILNDGEDFTGASEKFIEKFNRLTDQKVLDKGHLIELLAEFVPNLSHEEKGSNLDQKM